MRRTSGEIVDYMRKQADPNWSPPPSVILPLTQVKFENSKINSKIIIFNAASYSSKIIIFNAALYSFKNFKINFKKLIYSTHCSLDPRGKRST